MKVLVQHETGILTLPKECATLERATETTFTYRVTYRVDPGRALRQNAIKVRISFRLTPPGSKTLSLLRDGAANMTAGLLTRASQQKDASRGQAMDQVVARMSDITTRIPNQLAGILGREDTVTTFPAPTVTMVGVAELRRRNVEPTVLYMPLVAPPANPVGVPGTQATKEAALSLLRTRQDPAMVV
mgnify:CR=1 FL=1